jgi:hypothetical protein
MLHAETVACHQSRFRLFLTLAAAVDMAGLTACDCTPGSPDLAFLAGELAAAPWVEAFDCNWPCSPPAEAAVEPDTVDGREGAVLPPLLVSGPPRFPPMA